MFAYQIQKLGTDLNFNIGKKVASSRPSRCVCRAEAASDDKNSKLMRWYDMQDITCSRLCIRTPESGLRGVFAEEDIPAFDGIAVIPPHMIIQSQFKDMDKIVEVSWLISISNI
jgi:hypothetical protein